MRIKILSWEKYNPRNDVKCSSWFRLEYRLIEDPDFYDFTHEEFKAWIYILSQACRKNASTVTINTKHATATANISYDGVNTAIDKLVKLGIVEVLDRESINTESLKSTIQQEVQSTQINEQNPEDPAHVTSTLRPRYAHGTRTDATRRDETVRNVTDVTKNLYEAPRENARSAREVKPSSLVWEAYRKAYRERYTTDPVRNARTNALLSQLVTRIGSEEAPLVAEFYVFHNDQFYVKNMHAVGLMLKDAEKLRTEWATGRTMLSSKARAVERTQHNNDSWSEAARILNERDALKHEAS